MRNASGISDSTRKWLVALGMIQDLRDHCYRSYQQIRKEGYPLVDRDKELLDALQEVRDVVNLYLTDQIRISLLGAGKDNLCQTSKI